MYLKYGAPLSHQEPTVLDNIVSSPARGRLTVTVPMFDRASESSVPMLDSSHESSATTARPRPPKPRPAHKTVAVRYGLITLLLGVGAALRAVSLYQSPTPGNRESGLVTQVVELSRLGVLGTIELGRLPVKLVSLATPQLAAICAGSGAWGRVPTALGAVRESGIALWLGVALLTLTLARRLGAGRHWSLLAPALLAVCPAAIASARIAAPENVAALWAMLALVLATRNRSAGRKTLWTDLGVTACLSIAVLSAPAAVALLPAVLLMTVRQGSPRRVALVGGSVLFITGLGASVLMATAATSTLVSSIPAQQGGWFGYGWPHVDILTPIFALGCSLLALRSHRVRPLAVGVLALVPVSALVGAPAANLTLPLVATMVAVLVAETKWQHRWSRPITVTALALALGLGWAMNYAGLVAVLTPPPTAQAMVWLRDHVPSGQRVLTDPRSRVALVAGTDDWNRISTINECRLRSDVLHLRRLRHCDQATWWVVDPSVDSGLPEHSALVAVFTSPENPRHIEIRSAPLQHRAHN